MFNCEYLQQKYVQKNEKQTKNPTYDIPYNLTLQICVISATPNVNML